MEPNMVSGGGGGAFRSEQGLIQRPCFLSCDALHHPQDIGKEDAARCGPSTAEQNHEPLSLELTQHQVFCHSTRKQANPWYYL